MICTDLIPRNNILFGAICASVQLYRSVKTAGSGAVKQGGSGSKRAAVELSTRGLSGDRFPTSTIKIHPDWTAAHRIPVGATGGVDGSSGRLSMLRLVPHCPHSHSHRAMQIASGASSIQNCSVAGLICGAGHPRTEQARQLLTSSPSTTSTPISTLTSAPPPSYVRIAHRRLAQIRPFGRPRRV